MLVHWIWLAHRPGLSQRMKYRLLEQLSTAEAVYAGTRETYARVEELSAEGLAALEDKDLSEAWMVLGQCADGNIQILTMADSAYPRRLKHIPDPPVLLYYKGTLPDFEKQPIIGVVGTRKASSYGLATAKQFGYQIACCGGIVVSGLAKGIDAMAMEGAVLAGAPTVGVLGCGVGRVYPACNRELFRRTERYGCILSEYPPGTPPLKRNFPLRNRIIAGLSDGVLVVEAPDPSGALITADFALNQGRDVFAVPGNINNLCCAGSNALLGDGARAVTSGWEVIREYQGRYPDTIRMSNAILPEQPIFREPEKPAAKPAPGSKKQASERKPDKKVVDKEQNPPYIDLNEIMARLSEDEKAIVNALRRGVRSVDDVIAETGFSTGRMLSNMTVLELKNILVRLPGKRIELRRENPRKRS